MSKVKLPKSEVFSKWFEYWKSHDLKNLTSEDVDKKILELYRHIGCAGFANDRVIDTSPCFRIRKYEKKDLEEISDLWEPKPEFCTKRGRCNAPGIPVLYASDNAITPLKEMKIKPNDIFWFFKYKAKKSFSLLAIGAGVNDLIVKEDFWGNDKKSIESNKLLWDKFKDFILGEFTKPVDDKESEHYYLISEAICRLWLDIKNYYGWSYPSVNDHTKTNYAIKQKFIREAFDLENAWLLKLLPFKDKNVIKALKKSGHYNLTLANNNSISPLFGFPETRPVIEFDNNKFVPIILKNIVKPITDKVLWNEHIT